ncbi:coproporphyrinogen III oxidase [Dactylosporangium roseum]|uniref:Heme chaperone HemW n=1 Tax=Dactylosporangium roseum TaxID=47989 RepID=A0ABY5Z473_9ACTN|nr:radical SAM family heme chaperone HemW [Dactylosporangium roseum]UWZ35553.1 coproporphyrinogen III oxidase [Dactylosporangium roseum]
MPGALPEGEPIPPDGSLPDGVADAAGASGFGVYVHVPFCATRCGYCDFNTYTAGEGVVSTGYVEQVLDELALAAKVVRPPCVDTVFFGGGTPTLLPPAELGRILEGVDRTWGLAAGAEVTTEANPESVDRAALRELRAAGFNRISLGMQSVAPQVLAVLDRRHTPGRPAAAVAEAHAAGFSRVNLDLIYGAPGERAEDFASSLRTAIDAGVDHVSAYALIVEDGTRMAARMRRGELPYPDDDVAADRYLAAEETLTAAGFGWYEVSNWSRESPCRHNELYWRGGDWWGLGPGAHSHVGGVRWWNVKHPHTYAARLADGVSPGQAREVLTPDERHMEDVLLRIRLSDGLPLPVLSPEGLAGARDCLADGQLDAAAFEAGRAVLTLRGRLLADLVARTLT